MIGNHIYIFTAQTIAHRKLKKNLFLINFYMHHYSQQTLLARKEAKNIMKLNKKLQLNSDIIRFGNNMNAERLSSIENNIKDLKEVEKSLVEKVSTLRDYIKGLQSKKDIINNQTLFLVDESNNTIHKLNKSIDDLASRQDVLHSSNLNLENTNKELSILNDTLLDKNKRYHDKLISLLSVKSNIVDDARQIRDELKDKKEKLRALSGKESLMNHNLKKHADIYQRIKDEKENLKRILDLKAEFTDKMEGLLKLS